MAKKRTTQAQSQTPGMRHKSPKPPSNLVQRRWNPRVAPDDIAFQETLKMFQDELADPSQVEKVVDNYFTSHERLLLIGIDESDHPAFAEVQAANARRYRALLASPRFQGWAEHADLAFKMTLLYFGLPVASLKTEKSDRTVREFSLGANTDALRFLNYYAERTFGKGGTKDFHLESERYYWGNLYTNKQLPHVKKLGLTPPPVPSVSMRGGGMDNDGADEFARSESDNEDGQMTPGSGSSADFVLLKAGQTTSTPIKVGTAQAVTAQAVDTTQPDAASSYVSDYPGVLGKVDEEVFHGYFGPWEDITLDTELSRRDNEYSLSEKKPYWIPLYGLQGVVWFDLYSVETFVDAVDRVLNLDSRGGASYILSLYDKTADYNTDGPKEEWYKLKLSKAFDVKGEGDFTTDSEALKWVLRRLQQFDDPANWALAITTALKALPEPYYDPVIVGEDVISFVMTWKEEGYRRPDIAYLRLPKNLERVDNFTDYGMWMYLITRLLTPGNLDGRPGKPSIPDASFSIYAPDDRNAANDSNYGGLNFSPVIWEYIQDMAVRYKQRVFILEGQRLEVSEPCFRMYMPGYQHDTRVTDEWPTLPFSTLEIADISLAVNSMVQRSMSSVAYGDLDSIAVSVPGDSFFLNSAVTRVVVPGRPSGDPEEPASAQQSWQHLKELLTKWATWLTASEHSDLFPQLVTVYPIFKRYSGAKVVVGGGRSHVKLNAQAIHSMTQIRKLPDILGIPRGREFDPATMSIRMEQMEFPGWSDTINTPNGHMKPILYIHPDTDDAEWRKVRRQIVLQHIAFSAMPTVDVKPRFSVDQEFGVEDLYEKDLDTVFRNMRGFSRPFRFLDRQLWKKELGTDFPTVPPITLPITSMANQRPPAPRAGPTPPPPGGPDMPLISRSPSDVKTLEGWTTPGSTLKTGSPPPVDHLAAPAVQALLDNTTRPNLQKKKVQFDSSTLRDPIQQDPKEPDPTQLSGSKMGKISKKLRAYSYFNPLTVQGNRNIPTAGPALEEILDLRNTSTPAVSLAVLTPTEVRRLQINHHDMRNLALDRILQCPHPGCSETFPAQRADELAAHALLRHTAELCNFCNEKLYSFWTPEQRCQHFIDNHRRYFWVNGDNTNAGLPGPKGPQGPQPTPAPATQLAPTTASVIHPTLKRTEKAVSPPPHKDSWVKKSERQIALDRAEKMVQRQLAKQNPATPQRTDSRTLITPVPSTGQSRASYPFPVSSQPLRTGAPSPAKRQRRVGDPTGDSGSDDEAIGNPRDKRRRAGSVNDPNSRPTQGRIGVTNLGSDDSSSDPFVSATAGSLRALRSITKPKPRRGGT